MIQTSRPFISLIVLLVVSLHNAEKVARCPIGFKLAYTKDKSLPICYRRKGLEAFGDKFVDCAGNMFTSELYENMDIMRTDIVLWAEYKSSYPGGPFVDWSYTRTMGNLLPTSADIVTDDSLSIIQDYCVVIDPISNFTVVSCDGHHYRYCFIEPYYDVDTFTTDDCESLEGSWRFSSPTATCLVSLNGTGGGTMRATWQQAKESCEKRNGFLLNTGWRYSNHPIFNNGSIPINLNRPLAIYSNPDHNVLHYAIGNSSVEIPKSEWNFRNKYLESLTNATWGAINGDFWYLVNSTEIFYNVICEMNIELESVTLDLTIDSENKIILSPSTTVSKKQIYCFTDSVKYYPESVETVYDDVSSIFIIKPKRDGYYWCVHIDSKNFNTTESNKVLFIREKTSLINGYAIKIQVKNKYKYDNVDKSFKYWEKKLKEYVFYSTLYANVSGKIDTLDHSKTEKILKDFKSSYHVADYKEKEIMTEMKIKRLYLDSRTALVHANLNPKMKVVPPGTWDNLEVISMKPVYYCKTVDSVPTLSLDQSSVTPGCKKYKCTGDYNEGVQWVITTSDECIASTTIAVSDSARTHDNVTLIIPTVGTMIPLVTTPGIVNRDHSDSSEESTEKYKTTTTTEPHTIISTDAVSTVVNLPENITTYAPKPTRPTSTTPPPSEPTPSPPPEPTTTGAPIPTTRPPPQQQLDNVMANLQDLIDNTEPIFVENITEAFVQVDELLSSSHDLEFPGELLHLLDDIGSRLNLPDDIEEEMVVKGNIALVAADAQHHRPVNGLRIINKDSELFTETAFQIIREQINSTHLSPSDSEMVVQLPPSVAESTRRISFVVFRTDRAFQSDVNNIAVNSRILSVNVENFKGFETGEEIDIYFTPLNDEQEGNLSRVCAFWQFLENNRGQWSSEGCRLIRAANSSTLDVCRCNHLTHFAEILMPRTSLSPAHETALELISVVGSCLSILGLLLIGLTAILFRSWRRDFSNKIWLQLCVAIFILVVCFLIAVYAGFQEYSVICMIHGVVLHYSVLASFCWMLVAAVLSYRRLVTVFTRDVSHKLLKAAAFSWGAPCAVVGILLSVDPRSYAGQFEESMPSGAFCYPSGLGLWLSVYAPIAFMLLVNWTLFILIVRSVFASRRIPRHGDSNEAIRCISVSCLLVFLFGLPWVFGLFPENIVTVYLFSLTVACQGFVLFLFFVVGNKKTRDLWLNKLKIKQTRKIPVTSSTFTNRSTGNAGARGGNTPAGSNSIEAKVTKPKSLASPDNSRFS